MNESRFIYPTQITADMIRRADPGDSPSREVHFAANLNAMLALGYCSGPSGMCSGRMWRGNRGRKDLIYSKTVIE